MHINSNFGGGDGGGVRGGMSDDKALRRLARDVRITAFAFHRYLRRDVPVFESRCSDRCVCDEEIFSPICGADGVTYYSACHAGCRNQTFGKEYSAGYKVRTRNDSRARVRA